MYTCRPGRKGRLIENGDTRCRSRRHDSFVATLIPRATAKVRLSSSSSNRTSENRRYELRTLNLFVTFSLLTAMTTLNLLSIRASLRWHFRAVSAFASISGPRSLSLSLSSLFSLFSLLSLSLSLSQFKHGAVQCAVGGSYVYTPSGRLVQSV